MPLIPEHRSMKQEDPEFEANQELYSETPYQNNNKNTLELCQVKWLVPLISALGRLRQKHLSASPAQAIQ